MQGLVAKLSPQQDTKSDCSIQNVANMLPDIIDHCSATTTKREIDTGILQSFFLTAIDSQYKYDFLQLHVALTHFLPISYQGSLTQTSHTFT